MIEQEKKVLAQNIIELRKKNNLTQSSFAEKLNYSDKAISKWERAEAFPDIFVLKNIANLFNVSVDYLLENHEDTELPVILEENTNEEKVKKTKINKYYLTLLAASPIWIIAMLIFVFISIFIKKYIWFVFYISVPLTSIIFLIFNSIYGNKRKNYLIVSTFVWTLLGAIYFSLFKYNPWQVFLLGIPAQIVIIFWSKLKQKTTNTK